MALVSLTDVTFDYGREPVLNQVGLDLQVGVKYALVGANGAGKSTLLAAIAGELDLPAAARQVTGSLRIRRLHQESAFDPGFTAQGSVIDAVAAYAFVRELQIESELQQVAGRLDGVAPSEREPLIRRQGALQAEFEALDGYTLHARLETALQGVGLRPDHWQRPFDELSGGERRRAALAAVLLGRSDLLLLDEPTNHLDLESCEWLESYLADYSGAAVLVSHDRHFLDRLATRTLHLRRGRLTIYSGNYSFYEKNRQQRLEQEQAEWRRQQEEIASLEDYIQRNIAGQKTRQAQSRRKKLAKIERIDEPLAPERRFGFRLAPERPSGSMVLQAEGIGKGFGGRPLFAQLELHVVRGDRIGVIGPNGCGKTTLLKMLAGQVAPDTGTVTYGHNVDLGLYDQELQSVAAGNTVYAEMSAVDPTATVSEVRTFLGAFGFGADLYDRRVADLSGGQRSRLALIRMIKQGYNTLLLDEPTNHLDVRSRESLEKALSDFDGTLIVVSHDRRFLDKVVQKLVVFSAPSTSLRGAAATLSGPPEVSIHLGGYSDYVRRQRALRDARRATARAARSEVARGVSGGRPGDTPRAATAGAEGVSTTGAAGERPLSKNERARRQQWVAEIEKEISVLEEEKAQTIDRLGESALSAEDRLALANRCGELDEQLLEKMARWEALHRELDQGVRED